MWASPIVALLLMQLSVPPVQVLQASSKFMLDRVEGTCQLAQRFGPDGSTLLGIMHQPTNTISSLRLVSAAMPTGLTRITLRNERSREEISVPARSASLPNNGGRMVEVYQVDNQFIARLAPSAILSFQAEGRPPLSVALSNLDAARPAIARCEAELLHDWGIDPAPLAQLRSLPEPANDPRTWVTYSDYPSPALRSQQQGRAAVRIHVSSEGRVTDCATAESSGSSSLDSATCRLLSRRARFRPALGSDGVPTDVWLVRIVTWAIP